MHGQECTAPSMQSPCGVMQVPNEKLMTTDIVNITESKVLQDRVLFEVDASVVTPEAMADLSSCVHEIVRDENVQHLYDQDFVPYAAMVEVRDPLKYQVRAPACGCHARICARKLQRDVFMSSVLASDCVSRSSLVTPTSKCAGDCRIPAGV